MKKPMFIVTGTSGCGKTTVIPHLREILDDVVVYDGDSVKVEDYNVMKCNWLSVALNNLESNIYTVLCLTVVPENLIDCEWVSSFSSIHYINLQITDEVIEERLKGRGWDDSVIEDYISFSHWLSDNGEKEFDPTLHQIQCEDKSPIEIAMEIKEYILKHK